MSFPFFDETKELNEATRREAPGRFISLPGGVTHYQLDGPEMGEAIVLVHGFSVPFFIFDALFVFLTCSGYRVLRYDLFGRGYSDRPNTRYTLQFFVDQLLHLLDGLHLQEVTLLGLSMGGPITAAFLRQHPARVCKHILVDPSGGSNIKISPLLKMIQFPILGEALLALFGTRSMVKRLTSDFFDPKLVEEFQARYQFQMQFKGFMRAILSTLRCDMLEPMIETYQAVGKLGRPTLIFWGKNDLTVPFDDHRQILQAIPHAEFHALENCGHLPHFEKPQIINPVLLDFLARE